MDRPAGHTSAFERTTWFYLLAESEFAGQALTVRTRPPIVSSPSNDKCAQAHLAACLLGILKSPARTSAPAGSDKGEQCVEYRTLGMPSIGTHGMISPRIAWKTFGQDGTRDERNKIRDPQVYRVE
jgi:hypothetical protein